MAKRICRICGVTEKLQYHWVAHSTEQFVIVCKKHHKEEHKKNPQLDIDFPDYKWDTLTIRRGTKIRIKREGVFGETWDDLLNRIMDDLEEWKKMKDRWQARISR